MTPIIIVLFTLAVTSAYGYHDPDLNYHLNQVQKLQECDNNGYSYPTPSVQLTTAGVKVAARPILQAPAYQYSGYTTGAAYQAVVPQTTYITQQPATYQTSSLLSQANYATATASKEVHGYATSAGLSSVDSSRPRTVIPQATYAQAPILAKVTAAPLIARFSVAPAKTSFVSQNYASQVAGSARASLNSYGAVQSGGTVVSQVIAAPSATYATSSALKSQQPQLFTPTRYTTLSASVPQYNQVGPVQAYTEVAQYASSGNQYATSAVANGVQYVKPAVNQYVAPAAGHYSAQNVAQVSHYSAAPAVSQVQYAVPTINQYSAPEVKQYSAPAVTQYSAPVVTQHSVPTVAQYSAPVVAQYSAPAVAQYAAPATQYSAITQHSAAGLGVAQYATSNIGVTQHGAQAVSHVAPAVAQVAVSAPVTRIASTRPVTVKNVHTDFLENYDAHPRYAYEYSVNDPHTGDIKQQKEERDGEVVKGQYSLVEPDGSVRTVDYVADWKTGFHADVRNSKDNH
ncbi:unnamed protein product [Chilo suppressalis]|uniref:Cuticle protein n=1 Tax=Chilo suppressalis TaxID=168631 RepID=A0ABN8BCT6_CHISP|nr:unnamed protein product [Chilo suppressalis]